MIDMGMREDEDIDRGSVAGASAVKFESLLAFTLKQTAVKHYTVAVYFDEMLGPGYGLCCAMKCYLHFFST
jgi:hypothetical protein